MLANILFIVISVAFLGLIIYEWRKRRSVPKPFNPSTGGSGGSGGSTDTGDIDIPNDDPRYNKPIMKKPIEPKDLM